MIKRKDLINRVYSGRECIAFDFILYDNSTVKEKQFLARFERNTKYEKVWKMTVVLDREEYYDSQVYAIEFLTCGNDTPLESIAYAGLKNFQLVIEAEIQKKSQFDFLLSDLLRS